MPVLKLFTITKMLEYYNDWITMELLDNKTPQVVFDIIHVLIIALMSTNT